MNAKEIPKSINMTIFDFDTPDDGTPTTNSNDNGSLIGVAVPGDQLLFADDDEGKDATDDDADNEEDTNNGVAAFSSPHVNDDDTNNKNNGPCSNDNPHWDKETVPCPGATTIFNDLLLTTDAPTPPSNSNNGNDGNAIAPNVFDGDSIAAPTTTTTTAATTELTTTTIVTPSSGVNDTGNEKITNNSNDLVGNYAVTTSSSTVVAGAESGTTTINNGSVHNDDGDEDNIIGGSGAGVNDEDTMPVHSTSTISASTTVSTISTDESTITVESPFNIGSTITSSSTTVSSNESLDTITNESNDETSYPSFYSCTFTSEEDLFQTATTTTTNTNVVEVLSITFNYEIYTATTVEDITTVLSLFERQLANGVASSLGLIDCQEGEETTSNSELAIEISRSSAVGGTRGRKRRTLQKEGLNRLLLWDDDDHSSSNSLIVGVSMNPVDELDTSLGELI